MTEVKCSSCKYREVFDGFARLPGDPKGWKPIRCARRDSDYYHAWLNISVNGEPLKRVQWSGCPYGERMVRE